MTTPKNTERLVARLNLDKVQEIYEYYGLGGLCDYMNEQAKQYNSDLMDMCLDDDELMSMFIDGRVSTILSISQNEAYDTMRSMEQ